MKKLFISAFFIFIGMICMAQQPNSVKPVLVTNNDKEKEELIKMKEELKRLLVRYDKQLNAADATMNKIETLQKKFDDKMKDLEAKDKLGNFEIQDLMSQYNQSESTTSNVLKKLSDTKKYVINKI
jgi:predicted nuclease with TOPRIM domain